MAGARPLLITALRLAPLHALSRVAGWLADLRLPPPLRAPVYRAYGRATGVDFDEVAHPLADYPRFQDFFTRALPAGARPLDPAPDALLAPCDGYWGASGSVRDGRALQVKGWEYDVGELVGDPELGARLDGGAFATFYLAPGDYHRFHAPCAGEVVRARYLPGALWPVNRIGVEGVAALFARNERLVAELDTGAGPPLALVAVGATCVGRIRVGFDDLHAHARPRRAALRTYAGPRPRLERGQEWGRFELGSSLVLVAPPGAVALTPAPPGSRVRVGTRIGALAGGA